MKNTSIILGDVNKMNKKVLFVLILLMFGSIPINVSSQTWENEYGKLEVWPDTSRNIIRQKQYYNATWYYPDNTLDIAFCFDEPLSWPYFVWIVTRCSCIKRVKTEVQTAMIHV